jgi:hypothetical protein
VVLFFNSLISLSSIPKAYGACSFNAQFRLGLGRMQNNPGLAGFNPAIPNAKKKKNPEI